LQDEYLSDFEYGSVIFEVFTGFSGIIGAVEIFNDGFFFFWDKIGERFIKELVLRLYFGVVGDELFLSTSVFFSI